MTLCLTCRNEDGCVETDLRKIRGECEYFKPTINAGCIRAMSDEELAKAFVAIAAHKRPSTYTAEGFCLDDGEVSETDWLSWLKSPVEKGT